MGFGELQRGQEDVLLAVVGALPARPYLRGRVLAPGIHVDALVQAKGGDGALAVFVEQFLERVDEGAGIRVLARRLGRLVNGTRAQQFEALVPVLGRLDKVARVARVENGQDVALDVLVAEQVLGLVPGGARIPAERSVVQQRVAGQAARELEAFACLVEDAVAGVVYNEEVVGAVVPADEVADVAVELVLRLLADVQLDNGRRVVERVAEEGVELAGLCVAVSRGRVRHGQPLLPRTSSPVLSSSSWSAHLIISTATCE